jgi:hypothetical protein
MGVTIIIKGAISMKVPSKSRLIRTNRRIRKGELVAPKIKFDIMSGASRSARSQPKAAAAPMISIIMEVVFAEFTTAA